MNPPNWADVTVALTSVGSFLITGIGLYAVFIQIRKLRLALWSDTQARLCDQTLEVIRFLAERPETYDYFYRNKPLEENDPNEAYILYSAEALATLMEHLTLQKSNVPELQWAVWERFIVSQYKNSSVIQNFLQSNRDWYSNELLSIIDDCDKRTADLTLSAPSKIPKRTRRIRP